MRTFARWAAVAVMLAFSPVLRAADAELTDLAVTVRDGASKATVAGVKVDLRAGRSSISSYTSADGIAHLHNDGTNAAGWLRISASSEGYCPVYWMLNEQATGGKTPATLDLVIEKAVGISGVVVDQDGKPLVGAKLMVTVSKHYADARERLSASWISATSDADGKWSVPGVPETFDRVELGAYHRECLGTETSIQPKPFADIAGLKNGTAALKLTRGVPVRLVVQGAEGQPVRNARVAYGVDRNSSNAYPEEKVDAQGTLTLGIVPGTATFLTITAKGRSPELLRPTIGATEQTIPVTLAAGHALTGTVLDGGGDPVVGAQVSVDTWRGVQTLHPRLKTDGDGKFTWPDAPADEVVISVYSSSGQKDNIRVKAGQENVIKLPAPTTFKGTVVDAATGQPVTEYKVMAGIRWDLRQPMYWENPGNIGTEVAPDGGTFEATLTQNYPWRSFRVTADGYLPSDSTPFQMEGKDVSFTFKMEKGKSLNGTVMGVDGKALAGATVVLVTPGSEVQIQNGNIAESHIQGAPSVTTGADGAFTLPPQRDNYLLTVVSDAGYAQVSRAEFEKQASIPLKPWGKVEGTARRGTKADPGAQINGWASANFQSDMPLMSWSFSARADRDGKFSMNRVLAGPLSLSRRLDLGNNRSTETAGVLLKIIPGETTKVMIGGVGRPIVGHMMVPTDVAAKGFAFSDAMVQPTMGTGGRMGSQFMVEPDGSFRVDDVAEGSYTVHVTVTDLSTPNNWRRGNPIGSITGSFTMPAVAGGVSDEPLDVGTLTMAQVAAVGSQAPDFSVTALDGSAWKLSEQKGKYVLLEFWSATYSPGTAVQPKLAEVWNAFGKDARFTMIGLSMGDQDGAATKKFVEGHDIHWPVAALGRDRRPLLVEYPMQGFPMFWLIGPDGMVVGQNVKADQLETLVGNFLKNAK